MLKKLLLGIAILTAFYVGYAATANAWPGVPDRDRWYGYFKNQRDTSGLDVFIGGIPGWVQSAESYIFFIKSKLAAGPGSQDGVGAAFIIQTMIGLDRSLPPQLWQIQEWEGRIRFAEERGLVNWNQWLGYTVNSYYQDGPVDDAFYYENGASNTIVFRDTNGSILYSIRRECANPVGTVLPLADAPNYTLTGRTTVPATVLPGGSVTFRHYIRNSGPDSVSAWWASKDSFTSAGITAGFSFFAAGTETNVATEPFTVPANAPFGTRYCRFVDFIPAQNGSGYGRGADACTQVVADFELTPVVDPNGITAAQQNDLVTFTYRVLNSGPTRSQSVTCKPVGNTRPPGYTPLPQQDVDRNSDPGYVPPATTCPQELPVGTTTVANEVVDVGNAAPGTRICRSLVINPKNETGGFRASAETCIVIAKTPYVHFMGNDVWAGGGFAAINPACNAGSKIQTVAHNLRDGTVAGSATEYAAFALGRILSFGSANKALSNPAGIAGKVLTFSNWDSNNLGFYGATQHCINDYVDRYSSVAVTAEPASINVGARGSGTWHTTGAHQFSGDMPVGAQQIYLIEGDVTITNNLRYPATYGSQADIPSLVIIATGNMIVQSGVTQMDGLFISRGTFATCNPGPGNLSVSICNNQLFINGAVIANRLDLLRTAGADGGDDTARKRPAEVFNFNPEFYLRNALTGTNSNILRTIDQKDLPPRF